MEISILGAFLPFAQSLRHKGDYMQKDYILGSLISISPPRFNSTNHIYILISTVVCKSSARCNLSLSMITIALWPGLSTLEMFGIIHRSLVHFYNLTSSL